MKATISTVFNQSTMKPSQSVSKPSLNRTNVGSSQHGLSRTLPAGTINRFPVGQLQQNPMNPPINSSAGSVGTCHKSFPPTYNPPLALGFDIHSGPTMTMLLQFVPYACSSQQMLVSQLRVETFSTTTGHKHSSSAPGSSLNSLGSPVSSDSSGGPSGAGAMPQRPSKPDFSMGRPHIIPINTTNRSNCNLSPKNLHIPSEGLPFLLMQSESISGTSITSTTSYEPIAGALPVCITTQSRRVAGAFFK